MNRRETHLHRDRLVAVIRASPVTTIEAPGGYGKTSLAFDAARHLHLDLLRVLPPAVDGAPAAAAEVRKALAGIGLARQDIDSASSAEELATAFLALLRPPDTPPLLVVFDEAQRLGAAGRALVRELSIQWDAEPHRLVLAGRRLPARLRRDAELSAHDLAFTVDEFVTLAALDEPATRERAEQLVQRLGGWPAALALVRSRGDPAWQLPAARTAERVVDDLVAEQLDEVDRDTAELAIDLAHLPCFDGAIARSVGGADAWDRIRALGLPTVEAASGRLRFSDPIAERITSRRPITADMARRAASGFVDAGSADLAVEVLLGADLAADAATLIGGLTLRELGAFDPAQLRAVDALLGDHTAAGRARIRLQRARLDALTGAIAERAALLDQARTLAAGEHDVVTADEAEAEQVLDLARTSKVDDARRAGLQLLGRLRPDEVRARATCLAGLGLAEATRPGGRGEEAAEWLREAAALFRHLDATTEAAGTLQWLGYWCHYLRGELVQATDTLCSAMDMLAPDDRQRGLIATFLGEIFAAEGRPDEAFAALDVAFTIGRARGDTLTLAYGSWVAAEASTVAGDLDRVRFLVADAERHRGDWWEHSTGTDFLAEVSQMYRRLGDLDGAYRYLGLAQARPEGTVPTRRFAEAAIEATHGDAGVALDQLAELERAGGLFAVHHPRVQILRAVAQHRLGLAAASDTYARARAEAAHLGIDDLLERVEPAAVALLDARPPRSVRRIELFGTFAVVVDGVSQPVPVGRASTLVKVLAVEGRPLALEEVLELLWPAEDPAVARRRLRNLLNRIRDEGIDVIVRTAAGLALAPGFDTDVAMFRAAAMAALADPTEDSIGRAEEALSLYRGELLPEDRYDDWTALPRERCARLYTSVLDRLARHAAELGDHARAFSYLDQAIAAEPYEDSRIVWAARLAFDAGHRTRARTYTDLACSVLAELGLAPAGELASLRARLG